MIYVIESNAGDIIYSSGHRNKSYSLGQVSPSDDVAGRGLIDLLLAEEWVEGLEEETILEEQDLDPAGYRLIAKRDHDDIITIYPKRMGASGRIYFGIRDAF